MRKQGIFESKKAKKGNKIKKKEKEFEQIVNHFYADMVHHLFKKSNISIHEKMPLDVPIYSNVNLDIPEKEETKKEVEPKNEKD